MTAIAFHSFSKTIDIPAGLRGQPLEAWQTSVRLTAVLRRSGVRVLGDLHGRKVDDFAWERNCGFKTLHELDWLARRASRDCERAEKATSAGNGSLPLPGSSGRSRTTADAQQDEVGFAIPGSVCQLQFHELPMTTRLANVVRSIGAQTLGDLKGRSSFELLQYRSCGWRTLGEIQQLIERAISGEFDEAQIEESAAAAELLTLLEQGMAKLSPRENQFLLARIGGEGLPCLTFEEIGRRCALTRARVQQLVARALDNLRKTWGPRIPRLLEMMKRRCLSMVCPLTPALLDQWIGESPRRFQLSTTAQVRLIAALDENIPCWPEKHHRAGRIEDSTGKLDLDLANLARKAGGHIVVAEAYRKLTHERHRRLTIGEYLRILPRVRCTVVDFKDPHIPIVRLRTRSAGLRIFLRRFGAKATDHQPQAKFVHERFNGSSQILSCQ
jgi:Sigma-70, region 4